MPISCSIARWRRRPLGLPLCTGLLPLAWGCTLLDEEFEPPLTGDSGAGGSDASGAAGTLGGPGDPGPSGCGSDAGSGLFDNEGNVCPGEIPIVGADDAGFRPDGSMAVGNQVELPCLDGLGAFGAPERVTGLGVDGELFAPSISADGLTLFFAVRSGESEHIYLATRDRLGASEFSNAIELSSTRSDALDGTPFISFDGLTLYFFSDRDGGVGSRDLWSARRGDPSSPFGAATELRALNTPALDMSPSLSRDELTLFFVSSRPNGRGNGENTDIWRSTRESTAQAFAAPENVAAFNSGANEGRIVFSSDGLLALFSSDRAGGRGLPDLWIMSRPGASGPFGPPQNLERLNSPTADHDLALTSDDRELFFASERAGQSELWLSARSCL